MASLVPPAAATASDDRKDEKAAEVTVNLTGDGLRYELAISPQSDVKALWVVVDGANVIEAKGFETVATGDRRRLKWTGAETARLVLSVELQTDGAADGRGNRESIVAENWAFTAVPFVEIQRATGEKVTQSWPLVDRGPDAEKGVFGARYALVGSTTVVKRSANGETVRVISPVGEVRPAKSRSIARALKSATSQLAVGDRNDSVLAFAVPNVREGGESIPARDEFWVRADEPLDSPNSVWLHEYVHTRQSMNLSAKMQWFREASAEYYAARLAYEQDRITEDEMRAHIDGPPSHATLTDPASWSNDRVQYRKGARVLAVLDHRIKEATDGQHTLEDVFRRLNRHEGTVTYPDFKRAVTEVAGTRMNTWLDRHVAGEEPVTGSYPAGVVTVRMGPLRFEVSPSHIPVAVAFTTVLIVSLLTVGTVRARRRRGTFPPVTKPERSG